MEGKIINYLKMTNHKRNIYKLLFVRFNIKTRKQKNA